MIQHTIQIEKESKNEQIMDDKITIGENNNKHNKHYGNVKIKKFNFWYADKKILEDINIDFHPNTISALIGPSGCGKSTLLRCINRMNDLVASSKFSGHIYYSDKDINSKDMDVTSLRRNIGMVFQKPNPFPMSIYENIAYGLRINGSADKHIIDETVKNSLIKADLYEEVKHRLNTSAFKLSGGQQQRLCIARALAINPDVLLLDEPCSALDPIATAKIESLLIKLKKECTIIIVTHNMQQAKRVSDNTLYMMNGKLIEHGDTHKIFENPREELTRKYINGEFG